MRLPTLAPRSLAALVLLAAAFALAPAARATITVEAAGSASTYEFGLADCESNKQIAVTFDYSSDGYAGNTAYSAVAFATTDSTCTRPTADSSTAKLYTFSTTGTGTGTITVTLADLLFGTACTAADATSSNPGLVYVCVQLYASGATTTTDSGSVLIEYATSPPLAPTGLAIEPGDGLLHVSWTEPSTSIATYQIYAAADPTDGGQASFTDAGPAATTSATSVTVQNTDDGGPLLDCYGTAPGQVVYLNDAGTEVDAGSDAGTDDAGTDDGGSDGGSPRHTQGIDGGVSEDGGVCTSYSIAITATDTFGNVSPLSSTYSGNVPYAVDDFYEYYRSKGGGALGCSSSDGLLGAGLALAGLALFLGWRTRRKKAALLLALLALGAAGASRADDYSISDFTKPQVIPTKSVFVGLELDKYAPHVDSEPDLNGATPYRDIFGDRIPWRIQGELGWEALHAGPAGTLVVGVSFGFWQNFGKGIFASGPDATHPSSDTTLLDVWPMGVEAMWRFDGLTDRIRWLPIIPYAKLGLMEALWVIYSGNGDVANARPGQTGHGEGWTPGYTASLGGALSLNALDPELAHEAYQDLGLQRTSLFVEYGWTKLNDFNGSGVLVLSDKNWRFGLAMEF